MDDFEWRLRARLLALERAVPVSQRQIEQGGRNVGIKRTAIAAIGAVVALIVIGGAVGGAFIVNGTPHGHEGFENPGEPFHGTGISCRTPPVADQLLRASGYSVQWQVENRGTDGHGSTTFSSTPPDRGVIEGGFVDGSVAYVVVAIGRGAHDHPGCANVTPSAGH